MSPPTRRPQAAKCDTRLLSQLCFEPLLALKWTAVLYYSDCKIHTNPVHEWIYGALPHGCSECVVRRCLDLHGF